MEWKWKEGLASRYYSWYRSMQRLEFDDTIHQIPDFQSEGSASQTPLTSLYATCSLVHRQDIFETESIQF